MPSNATETIDVRILRLIGLEDVFDLDYDTYLTLLKEAMVKGRMPKTTIPPEEVELLTNEWKRVKSKKDKGRFKVKTKKIPATSIKTGGIKGKRTGIKASKLLPAANGSDLETRVFNNERKITHLIKIVKLRKGNVDKQILDSVTSIADTLKQKKKLSDKEGEFDRKEEEEEKRKAAKGKLKERFKKVAQVAQKVIAPVRSILDKIINYFVMIFAGRVFVKLFEWFSNPDNKSKVDSIVRFLGDHWPKLLSLFLVFGTGLGSFIRTISGALVAGAFKLGTAALGLAAQAGLKGAGKWAGMLGGKWGKLAQLGVSTAVTVGTTMAISKGIEGGGKQEPEQGLSGGGKVRRLPGFSGGGMMGGLGGMMGGMGKMMGGMGSVGMGAMFGPLGMIIGGILSSKKDSNKPEGYVSGEEGVDKVPAKLTEGEFVMSTGAVEKYGLETLESMNAAGGGTNIPKILGSTTYAEGGGHIAPKPRDMNDGHGKVEPLEVDEDKKSKRKNLAIPTAPMDQSAAQMESKSSKGIGGDIAQNLKNSVTLTSNGGGNFPLRSGKTYSWPDIRPHHSDEGRTRSYAGKPVGPPKDYGIGVSPNHMPVGNANGPIPSPLAGKVIFADPTSVSEGYGNTVLLETAKGLMQFSHLSGFGTGIRVGASVSAGQIIGAQGTTGQSTGEHLHMNASKAGHEAFINYITTGKPITGSTSSIDRSLEDVDSATGVRSSPRSPTDQSTAQANRSLISPSSASLSTSPQLTLKEKQENSRRSYIARFAKLSPERKKELRAQGADPTETDAERQKRLNIASEKGRMLLGGEWILDEKTGKRVIKGHGVRRDAEMNQQHIEDEKRGGWLGMLNRQMMRGTNYGAMHHASRNIKEEDWMSQSRVKQKGAEAIGKYYSSSDGELYANYQEAVKARKERLVQLARDQAAAKNNKPVSPPNSASRDELLAAIAKVQADIDKSNAELAELVKSTTSSPSQPDTPPVPEPSCQAATTGGDAKAATLGLPDAPPGQQYGPMASDIRLKENIVKVGKSPVDLNIYEWNYKSAPNSRYRGVMAQEVLKVIPEAVTIMKDGFLGVYYDLIDVDMEVVY